MIDKFTKYLNSINNDIFKNVSFLQKRNRKCNIKNLFSTMIASSFGDNKECNFKFLYNSNKNISESTRSYWRSKIYNLHLPYDAYSYACDNNISSNNNIPEQYKHLYKRFNILAGDLTKTKSAYCNKSNNGKNIAAIGLSALFDIDKYMFRSYNISYNNDEIDSLLKHKVTKNDFIILDRYYSSYSLFNKLKIHTNFIIRLKKEFIKCQTIYE